jgi:hypothetical protein
MPGKHRKTSRPAAIVAMVVAPASVAAAAVTATSIPAAVPPDTTIAAPSVDLQALITPANSTSQFFAGTTYYGKDWTTVYGPQQVVPFLAGPQGIADAIAQHANDQSPTGVTASGWGAGQTGTALGILARNGDPNDLRNVKLVILDNNTNRAGGGFWTTYGLFAPLLLTSAEPTPSNLGVPVLDVAYEYNINSDAPTDPLNPFALGNSLAAYAYDYGAESTAVVPQKVIDEAKDPTANPADPQKAVHYHYVLDSKGAVVRRDPLPPGTTSTYVTIQSANLPLTRPLRLIPGGDIVADALDPTLTQLVNAGYQDGQPIPTDPTKPRPMTPGSSISNLGGVPGSVPIGLNNGANTATKDISDLTSFVTKPLDEAGKLPGISSLPSLSPSTLTNSSVLPNTLKASNPNFFAPVVPGTGTNNKPSSSAGTGANPVKNFTDQVKDAVNKVTGGLTGAKPAAKNGSSP